MVVTNALGVAFTATLLAASDAGVTFAFPEDGATNVLAWTKLAPASRDAVVAATRFVPVPPELAATFRQAKGDLARLADLEADGRLGSDEAARRRTNLVRAFRKACRKIGLSDSQAALLQERL